MPCALSQPIRRFTSAITSGPMPSPGRSSSLWVAMVRYLENIVSRHCRAWPGNPAFLKTMDAGSSPGMTTARGVLKRHCAIGKTPLLAARLCNRPLAFRGGWRENRETGQNSLFCAAHRAHPGNRHKIGLSLHSVIKLVPGITNRYCGPSFETATEPVIGRAFARPVGDLLRMRSNSLKHNNLMLRSE